MSTREREVVQMRESMLDGRRSYVTPHLVRGAEYVVSTQTSFGGTTICLIRMRTWINRPTYNIDEGMESCGEVADRWKDGTDMKMVTASLDDEATTYTHPFIDGA
jgi:hypothetical protein